MVASSVWICCISCAPVGSRCLAPSSCQSLQRALGNSPVPNQDRREEIDHAAVYGITQFYNNYSGKNLREDKRHAFINHKQIKDSGVADYILISKEGPIQSCQKYIDELVPISNYIKSKKIYFACKALNYRVNEKKWDGDRPLCVWVDWYVQNQSLFSRLNFDSPLVTKGNEIGNNIEKLLFLLKLDRTNFTKEISKIYKGF